ncbi:hypothetical protein STEG23_002240, partial [Scotinomys teguina]
AAPSYFFSIAALPLELSICVPEVNFQEQHVTCIENLEPLGLHASSLLWLIKDTLAFPCSLCSGLGAPRPCCLGLGNLQTWARGMNREGAPGKSPEEMYIQQKVRVLLMLRKMGSNLTASEEEFLRTYAGVVSSQLSQLPQHSIDQETEHLVQDATGELKMFPWSHG